MQNSYESPSVILVDLAQQDVLTVSKIVNELSPDWE